MFTFENVLSFAALLMNANLFHILTFGKQLTIKTESVDNDKSDKKLVTHCLTRATGVLQYIKNELEIAFAKTRTGLCRHGNFWTSLLISRV